MKRSERNKQVQQHNERVVRDKFQHQREEFASTHPIKPMNQKQRTYIELLNDKPIVIATGYPGTSKTYLATAIACDLLRTGKIAQIVFCRPNVSNSTTLGYFAGEAETKMAQWIGPMLAVARERMGVGGLEVAIKRGDIIFQPLETVKGMSAKNCWFICDEAEDLTIKEAQTIVTRIGEDATFVLAGDLMQSELGADNGLKWLIELAQRQRLDDVIGHIDFNHVNDIVRSDTVKRLIIAMNRESRKGV